jgi:uncharacterized integral membrane protein (TIGR00698 family)
VFPLARLLDRDPRLAGMLLALLLATLSYGLVTVSPAGLPLAGTTLTAVQGGLKVLGPLTIALLIGLAWRMTAGIPERAIAGTKFTARTVLRLGIVLMGTRLDLVQAVQAGPRILVLDLLMIGLGIVTISWLSRRLDVPGKVGVLLAVGTSICGASAVAAAAPVTGADEDETTVAVALCGLLGTAGVLTYVFLGRFLQLTDAQLAILSGSTLHEVAQVTAAAFTWGPDSGQLGTLVKMMRVVLLAPTLVVLGWWTGRGSEGNTYSWSNPPVPWFVLGFIGVGLLSATGLVPVQLKAMLAQTSVFLMVMAMAAMGLNTPLSMIQRAGWRTIQAGWLGFLVLAATSWTVIRFWHIP